MSIKQTTRPDHDGYINFILLTMGFDDNEILILLIEIKWLSQFDELSLKVVSWRYWKI